MLEKHDISIKNDKNEFFSNKNYYIFFFYYFFSIIGIVSLIVATSLLEFVDRLEHYRLKSTITD